MNSVWAVCGDEGEAWAVFASREVAEEFGATVGSSGVEKMQVWDTMPPSVEVVTLRLKLRPDGTTYEDKDSFLVWPCLAQEIPEFHFNIARTSLILKHLSWLEHHDYKPDLELLSVTGVDTDDIADRFLAYSFSAQANLNIAREQYVPPPAPAHAKNASVKTIHSLVTVSTDLLNDTPRINDVMDYLLWTADRYMFAHDPGASVGLTSLV